MKPSANVTPKVLIEMPRTWISGFMASRFEASSSSRHFMAPPSASATISPMASTRHSSFGKDTGLQARMLLTMFLLGLVYVVFLGVLFAVTRSAGVIIVVAVILLLIQLFASDKLAMATMGVKEVSPAEEPELHGIIERLCVQADLPKPRVRVMG